MMFLSIFNFVFSKKCFICGKFQDQNNLCMECFSNLKYISFGCKKCQQPLKYISEDICRCEKCLDKNYDFFDEMICALQYNPFLKNCILKFKNNNFIYFADFLCKFLYDKAKEKIDKNAIIVPVPLHQNRLFKRGYNQSLFLAKSFSKFCKIACISDLLVRSKDTTSQANKTFDQRYDNMKNAFKVNDYYKYLTNRQVLIIDDVITTGATMYESARALFDAGFSNLIIMSIARTIKV